MPEPRAYTRQELRDQFLRCVHNQIDYWEHEARADGCRAKLEGLAFSLLVLLDGEDEGFPACAVIPRVDESEEEKGKKYGRNWLPAATDIGGALHRMFAQTPPTRRAVTHVPAYIPPQE